ncbi:signal peptidase II [Actinosynnema pretiosum subsp. pretiosum]|uniref:Lipoprotein signal peptidase n=1 Tax=Actinosynnema pretiosum subsp. pretiosum TaxID=103721 RepID=A0AA45L4L2_9PSEU|nr:signal peptidase II [Actinosynnema pretiosum subsp. pretiosum]
MLDNGRVSTDPNTEPDAPDEVASPAPEPQPQRRVVLLGVIAAVVLALDIATKVVAVAELEGRQPVELFGGLLYLPLIRNPGAAFGMAEGWTIVLAIIAFGVVGFILWIARKLRSVGWAIGLGLVLGGALGNLADRIFRSPGPLRGHVVDFLSVLDPWGGFFPVFNLADSAICVGGGVIVLMSLLQRDYDGTRFEKKPSGKTATAAGTSTAGTTAASTTPKTTENQTAGETADGGKQEQA